MGASSSVKTRSRHRSLPQLWSGRSNLPNSNNRSLIRSNHLASAGSAESVQALHHSFLLGLPTGTLCEMHSRPIMPSADYGHNALQFSLQRHFDLTGLAFSTCYTAHVGGIDLQLPSDASIKASDQRCQISRDRFVYTFCAGHEA